MKQAVVYTARRLECVYIGKLLDIEDVALFHQHRGSLGTNILYSLFQTRLIALIFLYGSFHMLVYYGEELTLLFLLCLTPSLNELVLVLAVIPGLQFPTSNLAAISISSLIYAPDCLL